MELAKVAEKTHLEHGLPVKNACLGLAAPPVSHFIDPLWGGAS